VIQWLASYQNFASSASKSLLDLANNSRIIRSVGVATGIDRRNPEHLEGLCGLLRVLLSVPQIAQPRASPSKFLGIFFGADPQSGLANGRKIGRTQNRSSKDPALTQPPERDKQTTKRSMVLAQPDHRLDVSRSYHT